MDRDDFLSSVAVRGEISNCKLHSTGHIYFTLKDEESEISAVMFRSAASRLSFAMRNGMKVTVYGSVSVYEKSGKYQIYATAVTNDGVGALYAEYERLRLKLAAEGLFDEARKRPIPKFPKKIGIITSPTGAAIRDMINVTGRRYRAAELLIYSSLVQGAGAPESLRQGVEYLNADGTCDLIIIGRGGGSIEDLWAFNDEALVRAVAASGIPIISAVGHETDFTLCDFAADKRAPTPSAAAELAVPDTRALLQLLAGYSDSLDMTVDSRIKRLVSQIDASLKMIERSSPEAKLMAKRDRLSALYDSIVMQTETRLDGAKMSLSGSAAQLAALNPLAVLARGYGAIATEDGSLLRSIEEFEKDKRIKIYMTDGSADALITSTEMGNSLLGSNSK
ncbi:MAG: exodeoxyribonuclease VII large subunit [Clostridia bacterium]|nr:exodeoxyribonuclease VII large subunit [Clostridia bacterium]